MSILNFKEIPEAHKGAGNQDSFELLARDLFEALGYELSSTPGRGADGGKDLILTEKRVGISGNTYIRWLVSCKHKAHSGSSVLKTDEPEIMDSLRAHDCKGFIGFYSTVPSSGLVTKVKDFEGIEHQFFDHEKIEQLLLSKPQCQDIARRYFPVSYKDWELENPGVAQIFSDHEEFYCIRCNSPLNRERRGVVVVWKRDQEIDGRQVKQIRKLYTCCGGECDRILAQSKEYFKDGYIDAWTELDDYLNPTAYLHALMGFCNALFDPDVEYTEQAFEEQKTILLKAYPYICRNLSKKEIEQVENLGMIPDFLGGLARA